LLLGTESWLLTQFPDHSSLEVVGMKHIPVVLCAMLLIATELAFSQPGFTSASSLPPENWNIAGRRIGGVSVALADEVPQLQANPANLAFLTRTRVFLSLNTVQKKFDETKEDWDGTPVKFATVENPAHVFWSKWFEVGYAAAAFPFHLFGRQWAAAASYNGRHWQEFDERYFADLENYFKHMQQTGGEVNSVSVALAGEAFRKIRFGISSTRWFGHHDWKQEWPSGWTDDYDGHAWQLGITGVFGPLSLGSTIYLPRQVMKSSTTSGSPGSGVMTQDAKGAIEIGLGYHPWPRWTFGLGYVYQAGFEFKQSLGESKLSEETDATSRLSAGIEYEWSPSGLVLPLYAGFIGSWLSENNGTPPLGFYPAAVRDNNRFRSQLVLGAALKFNAIAFHADSRLTLSSSQTMASNLPPYS